jgi:hypothetical protein
MFSGPPIEPEARSVDTALVDVAQITELRTWASRLEERATDDELRAAAKAILMLVDEVENLQARLVVSASAAPPPVSVEPPPVAEVPALAPPSRRAAHPGLLARIKRTFGFE